MISRKLVKHILGYVWGMKVFTEKSGMLGRQKRKTHPEFGKYHKGRKREELMLVHRLLLVSF